MNHKFKVGDRVKCYGYNPQGLDYTNTKATVRSVENDYVSLKLKDCTYITMHYKQLRKLTSKQTIKITKEQLSKAIALAYQRGTVQSTYPLYMDLWKDLGGKDE